jgi:RraA family protein
MASIGYRIHPSPARCAPELLEAFRPLGTSHLSDCMGRLYGAVGLRRYHRTGKLVGTAFTVKTRPGDNLMVHEALDRAAPGDVLVVDGGGDVTNALVGELMGMYARERGLAGFVVDGAIRDAGWFDEFPCYARARVHRGPYKDGPGEINVPVVVGGMVVLPGDVVVGDEDGVVAIRPADAPALLEAARRKATEEQAMTAAIVAGRLDRSWIRQALSAKGATPEAITSAEEHR